MWRDPPRIQGIIFNIKIENAPNILLFFIIVLLVKTEEETLGTEDHKVEDKILNINCF